MKSGQQAIADVAAYLSDLEVDYEYTHWSETDLFSYYKLALTIVATANKTFFSKKTEIPLVAGEIQAVPRPCEGLTDFIFADSRGTRLPIKSNKAVSALLLPLCPNTDADYKVKGISYNPADPDILIVDPPVPDGINVSIYANCFIIPDPADITTIIDVPARFYAPIFELMLYYAWGVDTESAPSRERSQYHFNNAMFLLNISTRKNAAGTAQGLVA